MAALALAVIATFLASLGSCEQSDPPYKTMEFTQYVDHFDYEDTRQFTQKYLLNDQYGSSDVMLFYTGNEGGIEEFYDNSGFVLELAESFKALVVFAEHRYYGVSLPFGNDTFKPENMGYLSVEQALADYAVLIQYLKKEYSLNRVIAVGGSYGGMLTAYIRFKYPNLVDGGLAASAPILIVADLIDPAAFFAKVTQDFADVDPSCPDIARRAFSLVYEYAQSGAQGIAQLQKEFNACSLEADQVDHLVGWVKNSFTSLAMMDYPYPTNFLAPLPAYPVKEACHLLLQYPDTITGLAKAAALFYSGSSNDSSCFDIFTQFVECADPTGCGIGPDSFAWDYQACTEMRLPCLTNNVTDMFPPVTYDPSAHCTDRWGVAMRGNWTRTQLWGGDIQAASKIIFSNGNLDPWSVGGVLMSSNTNIDLVLIDKSAHHLDLRGSNPRDPPSVVAAREREKEIIKSWLD